MNCSLCYREAVGYLRVGGEPIPVCGACGPDQERVLGGRDDPEGDGGAPVVMTDGGHRGGGARQHRVACPHLAEPVRDAELAMASQVSQANLEFFVSEGRVADGVDDAQLREWYEKADATLVVCNYCDRVLEVGGNEPGVEVVHDGEPEGEEASQSAEPEVRADGGRKLVDAGAEDQDDDRAVEVEARDDLREESMWWCPTCKYWVGWKRDTCGNGHEMPENEWREVDDEVEPLFPATDDHAAGPKVPPRPTRDRSLVERLRGWFQW